MTTVCEYKYPQWASWPRKRRRDGHIAAPLTPRATGIECIGNSDADYAQKKEHLRLLFVPDVLFIEGGVGSRSREDLPASYLRPNRLVHGSREQSIHLLESNT